MHYGAMRLRARFDIKWRSLASMTMVVAISIAATLAAVGGTAAVAAETARDEAPVRIVAFGDSLTAGFQLAPSEAFPVQLEKALRERGHKVVVTNAGVSGDTTAAGLARFDWAIPDDTEAVILELGANDGLRGVPPEAARANLDKILSRLESKNIDILMSGVPAPTNWGEEYKASFDPMYSDLAEKYGALLYPFFLEGVALDPALNLPDGLHPNAKGVGIVVSRILPKVEELIARVKAKRAVSGKS